MKSPTELTKLTETLERQLCLFHELAEELAACRPAFMRLDVERMYIHIARQSEICENLRKIKEARADAWKAASVHLGLPAIDGNLRSWIAGLEAVDAAQFRRLLTELAVAEGEVRHQNGKYISLLDGSRRTLSSLARALTVFSLN